MGYLRKGHGGQNLPASLQHDTRRSSAVTSRVPVCSFRGRSQEGNTTLLPGEGHTEPTRNPQWEGGRKKCAFLASWSLKGLHEEVLGFSAVCVLKDRTGGCKHLKGWPAAPRDGAEFFILKFSCPGPCCAIRGPTQMALPLLWGLSERRVNWFGHHLETDPSFWGET